MSVPSTLTAVDVSGSCTERGTEPSAPWWKTISTPAHGGVDALVRAQVALDDLDVVGDVGEVLAAAGGEVVEHAHPVAAREQRAHEVRADEAGAAGDEHVATHAGRSATTWKLAIRLPGPGSRSCAERPSIAADSVLIPATSGLRDATDVGASGCEIEVEGRDHSEAGGRAGRGRHPNRTPVDVVPEQLLEPRVGPAPVVGGRRVVGHHAVRRDEHAAAGGGDAGELRHGRGRVVAVLEHLDAEDDVEARVLERQRLHRPAYVGVRVLDRVDADVRGGVRREERLVGLLAAAHVEEPVRAEVGMRALLPRRRASARAGRGPRTWASTWWVEARIRHGSTRGRSRAR